MSRIEEVKNCPFVRLRSYPGCFEDCPNTDACPRRQKPKPDEGLLTDEQIMEATGAPMVLSGHRRLVAKTASFLKAQEEVRVERIKKEIEINLSNTSYPLSTYHDYYEWLQQQSWWQEFWKRE